MSLVLITVIIEKAGDRYTAYSPNLLGVSVTADSREEVERQMRESIERYIEGLRARHESAGRQVRHPRQRRWLGECDHLKGGRTQLR
jgi:predicted RNase H-like HicB family nuclease